MKFRVLEALDTAYHAVVDPYLSKGRVPGWRILGWAGYYLCNAYDKALDQ